jgi:hypothetical protein
MAFDAFAANGPSATTTSSTSSAPPVADHVSAPSAPSNPTSPTPSSNPGATTPAPTPSSTPSASAAAPGAQTEGNPTEPAPFTPEWKFKVMDKEHEIPEMYRSLVKDAETQQQVKEIFEKAYGLDHVKQRHQALQGKYQEVNTAHTQVMSSIQELREHYQRGDFDTFFNRLQIPEEKILQWVINKAQYNQLPPEQRKVLDDKRAAEQEAFELRKQTQTYEQQLQAQQTQAKQFGLQIALEKPDVKQFAQSFDSAAGKKAGDFFREVVQYGEYVWYASQGKVDLTPEQAIQQVMSRYGGFFQPQAPQAPMAAPVAPAAATPPAPKPLPNLSGKGAASAVAARPKVRSLDDLKKIAASMGAR